MLELNLFLDESQAAPIRSFPPNTSIRPHTWTLDSYLHAIEAGVFPPEMRAELISGVLVEHRPIGTPHALSTRALRDLLIERCGKRYVIGSQEPVVIAPRNRPEPDAFVARGNNRDYAERDPVDADLVLICEVSDSSIDYDGTLKLKMYAKAGIPEYWIIDIGRRQLLVHTAPDWKSKYRQVLAVRDKAVFEHEVFGSIDVAALVY